MCEGWDHAETPVPASSLAPCLCPALGLASAAGRLGLLWEWAPRPACTHCRTLAPSPHCPWHVQGLALGLPLGAAPHCNPRGLLEHTGNGAIPGSEPALAPCCTQGRAAEA